MQFIRNGPDVPEALLQAHEEGRVVFFCGAGISCSANLPNFKGLVDQIYKELGAEPTKPEKDAYEISQYDFTLNYLEQRIPGQRLAIRKAAAKILQTNQNHLESTKTHAALLRLAENRNGTLRLVTTNYDKIFEHIINDRNLPYRHPYVAPALPVPKDKYWNGVVYLHGLLPSKSDEDESELNSLVITSGDFGLAYLNEGWAARFIYELFRNYAVCFVGYSLNDLVLRYMMTALTADRMLDETNLQTYAFVKCKPGQNKAISDAWRSMGVSSILYESRSDKSPHFALHQTLFEWAETYRDGIFGKEKIVNQHAESNPRQNDFALGRMLWALSDQSGRPAKRFSEINPTPPFEWLYAFSKDRLQHDSFNNFDNISQSIFQANFHFRIISQSKSLTHVSPQALSGTENNGYWDNVMYYISNWITRHLNNPRLVHWLIENNYLPSNQLSKLIDSKLNEYDRLLNNKKDKEPEIFCIDSYQSIPDKQMRTIWRLLLRGHIKPLRTFDNLYGWMDRLKHEGLSASLRMELRRLLSPKIALRKPRSWDEYVLEDNVNKSLNDYFDWKLVLSADYVRSALRDKSDELWLKNLPTLLDDFQQLLCDALGLLREIDKANYYSDHSFVHIPSIEPHWQNRGHRDWILLIEFLRDAWLAVQENDSEKATHIAVEWFKLPYPTFKRLAFFAASHDNCIDSAQWLDWLLSDENWWLWSKETQREVMRLLVLQGCQLSSFQDQLESAILNGPPRKMYSEHLNSESWTAIVDESIWLRLIKLVSSGVKLGDDAQSRLDSLSKKNQFGACYPMSVRNSAIGLAEQEIRIMKNPLYVTSHPLSITN